MYNLASDTTEGLAIGESIVIDCPDNLPYFRKYLSEMSKREGKKFTTKVFPGNKLHIMRLKYSNIYSKELE
jgi:hypothetical protein